MKIVLWMIFGLAVTSGPLFAIPAIIVALYYNWVREKERGFGL